MSPTVQQLFGVATSNTIEVSDVRLDGALRDDATVTASIADESGTPVAGVSWPITLGSDGAGTGSYSATLPSGASFVDGVRYVLTLTVVVAGLKLTLTRLGVGAAL